ncbi:uncharacterized protein LOC130014427 [Patella vulgata]|uniref:uncharacterized protein LOC130014427 n=1 Tax=Patella vulgata TaxID=6465 RepID=UPI0024A86F95|nr:uncharacterized protein LOC130014427 [Patella vulgata]
MCFKKNLKYFPRYSYRGCLLECLTDMVLERCGEVVSSMGGFMGFFLGASVLTVLEVFDYRCDVIL